MDETSKISTRNPDAPGEENPGPQESALAEAESNDMDDKPMLRLIILQFRLFRLLVRYVYLHIRYVELHIRYYLLKIVGAALVEALKMAYAIRCLSRDERLVFATCIALSIYILTVVMPIRI